MQADLLAAMPVMARHRGTWAGSYRHLDDEGALIDAHQAEIRCEMPDDGPFAYIQHNHFTWADGREQQYSLPGVLKDGRLWWDVPTFSGYAWQTLDDVMLLNLTRKDVDGANFIEMITIGATGDYRARSWHWFKDGQLYRRTLCHERLISRD